MNTRIIRFLFGTTIALMIALLLVISPIPVTSAPLAFLYEVPVNTSTDEYDDVSPNGTCSLREAIKSQNDNVSFGGCARTLVISSGTDTILLPSGEYILTRGGLGEDLGVYGDLDIRADVIISATGAATATVIGAPILGDRVFHVLTGTVTIKHIAIRGGVAGIAEGGGVLINSGASLILNDSEVAKNLALFGGGIYNYGTLTVTNSTFSGNLAGSYGGGIYNFGTATLTNVTISGNSASPTYGGGFFNNGTATLTNVTLSGNSATYGGGINNNGTAMLTNVTLSGNSATQSGGGIIISTGTVMLTNTIVSNSPSGGNCSGSPSGSFNLSSDGTCGFGAGRDNVNVMLAPLGNYGGPTLTHMPYGGPAINSGTNTGCPSTDQRGKPRPVNVTCDVGAVERQLVDYPFLYLPLIVR